MPTLRYPRIIVLRTSYLLKSFVCPKTKTVMKITSCQFQVLSLKKESGLEFKVARKCQKNEKL